MFGRKIYIHNAQSHSVCGNSSVFVASYLHQLVFGRPQQDDFAQEFFQNHSLRFFQNDFVELVQTLLQGKEKLAQIEESGIEGTEEPFYKGIIILNPKPQWW